MRKNKQNTMAFISDPGTIRQIDKLIKEERFDNRSDFLRYATSTILNGFKFGELLESQQ